MTRARRIRRLHDALRAVGLTEADGPEVVVAAITLHSDGTATVTEVTEYGAHTYQATYATPRHQEEDQP